MDLKSRLIFLVSFILLMAFPTFAQSTETKPTKTITACKIGLTPLGRTASFRFTFIYLVEVNQDGVVKEVKKLSPQKEQPFLKEDEMPQCIKTWKLEPSTKQFVSFNIGTTGGPNYISITNDKETLKIVLD